MDRVPERTVLFESEGSEMNANAPSTGEVNPEGYHAFEGGGKCLQLVDIRVRLQTEWTQPVLALFRFFFIYLAIYIAVYPVSALLGAQQKYRNFCLKPTVWVGHHVLHISSRISIANTGSSDKLCDYLFLLCLIVLAFAGTLVWSALDRKRADYERLLGWFRLAVRVAVGATLISYGAAKVFPVQFPAQLLSQLQETYGESSPMGLLWNFMGASRGYSAFAGGVEMLGGFLLFVPCCATLGALVSMAVMANVFLLNMCYDVPVKLFSFHLLLMSLFLLSPDARRLMELFLLKGLVTLRKESQLFRRQLYNRGLVAVTLGFGLLFSYMSLSESHEFAKQYAEVAAKTYCYGIWLVEDYTQDGKPELPLQNAGGRWQRVTFENPRYLAIQSVNGPLEYFLLTLDRQARTITIRRPGSPNGDARFTFENPERNVLKLTGTMDGHQIAAKLRKADQPKFALTSQGFRWIIEWPDNR